MSKQQQEVGRLLRLLFPDTEEEKDLSKVTNNQLHKGIRLDFWVPSVKLIVEVHGIQHYKPSGFGKDKLASIEAFSHQLDRDSKLRTICEKFSINYMEVPYDKKLTVKDFLSYMGEDDD